MFRDRPFNLKGGGYGFLFSSEFFFRTTQELEYFFVCRAKREIFFQNLTLGYMTKTLNQIILFFLHQNQNIFFSNIGNQNIVLEKKPYPPPLHVKWSFPHNYLRQNKLIYEYRSGFLPRHSTVHQLLEIYNSILNSLENKEANCFVFCDFSKAFDKA